MGARAAASVEEDVNRLLAGKTYDHLVALQKQIQSKLTSGEPIDTDYWENLLNKLLVWKAKVGVQQPSMLPSHSTFGVGETQNLPRSGRTEPS